MLNEFLFFGQIASVIVVSWVCRLLGSAALSSWLSVQAVLANLLVLKLVYLFQLEVTAADCFGIGAVFTLNLLREYHGADVAIRALVSSILLMLATAWFFMLHECFQVSDADTLAEVYSALFVNVTPILLVSVVVFFIVQVIDYFLFGYLQTRYGHYSLGLRMILSMGLSQFIDTALFTYWALGSWVPNYLAVLAWSYGLKVLIMIALSLSTYLRTWLFRKDGLLQYVQV